MSSNHDIDFKSLSLQLIRKTRGSTSQAKLNRQMKYRFNQISKWEIGKTAMKWSEFYEFAKHCGKPMDEILKKVFWFEKIEGDGTAFFSSLIAKQPIELVSKDFGISASTISRWANGKSEPKVFDVLKAVHLYCCGLPNLFEGLFGERLPAVFPNFEMLEQLDGLVDAKSNPLAVKFFTAGYDHLKKGMLRSDWIFSSGRFAMNAQILEKVRNEYAELNWKIVRYIRENNEPKDLSVVIGLQLFESKDTI